MKNISIYQFLFLQVFTKCTYKKNPNFLRIKIRNLLITPYREIKRIKNRCSKVQEDTEVRQWMGR